MLRLAWKTVDFVAGFSFSEAIRRANGLSRRVSVRSGHSPGEISGRARDFVTKLLLTVTGRVRAFAGRMKEVFENLNRAYLLIRNSFLCVVRSIRKLMKLSLW